MEISSTISTNTVTSKHNHLLPSRAAVEAQHSLLSTYRQQSRPDLTLFSVKEHVHVRLHHLPNVPELVRDRVPGSVDSEKYLIVNGTVIRTGSTKVLERVQLWRCNRCQGNNQCTV